MDEYGETTTIYVWPEGHEEGSPLPEGFISRVREALSAAGIEMETV